MSAAKKLMRVEAYLETGTVIAATAIPSVSPASGEGPAATTTATTPAIAPTATAAPLEVSLATGTFRATLAKSCLVTPEPGDKVLCAIDDEGVYVLAVLAGRAGAPTKIAAAGDLRLEARGGRVSVCGSEGVDVAGGGSLTIAAPEVHVRAQRGTVAVQEMGFFGRLLQAEVVKVALVAREVDSVVTRLSQRAKRVFRFVEEIDQTRAGTVDIRAQSMLGLRAENAVVSARVLTKLDGEQIHIG